MITEDEDVMLNFSESDDDDVGENSYSTSNPLFPQPAQDPHLLTTDGDISNTVQSRNARALSLSQQDVEMSRHTSDEIDLFDQFDDNDENEDDRHASRYHSRDNDSVDAADYTKEASSRHVPEPLEVDDGSEESFDFFLDDDDNNGSAMLFNDEHQMADENDIEDEGAFMTNEQLRATIEQIDSYQVEFVEGMSVEARRASIIYKLQCMATSLILQIVSSTTIEEEDKPDLPQSTQSSQQDSQESQRPAVQQVKKAKPPYHPITLKLVKRTRSNANPITAEAVIDSESQISAPAESQASQPPESQPQAQTSKFREIAYPTSKKSNTAKQMAMAIRIIELAKDALTKGQTITLRDIYYRDKKLFEVQTNVDKVVDDLAATMGIRRGDLNIQAASKGLVFGHLSIECTTGRVIDCAANSSGCLIPPADSIHSIHVSDNLRFVLVIEKEAIFRSLSTAAFHNDEVLGESIIITGKGYPDVVTRELVHNLCEELPHDIPILCLVDADPHGIDIFSVYRNGSSQMAFDDANLTAPRLRWLGVTAEDMDKFGVDRDYLLPLTESDIKKAKKMLQRENLDVELKQELGHMLESKAKAEIQILTSENSDGLMEYLRAKVPLYLS